MNKLSIFDQLLHREVISLVEYEFVRFLLQLDPKAEQEVLLAAAGCVHAQLNGHVCLDLNRMQSGFLFNSPESQIKISPSLQEKWLSALRKSDLLATNGELKPLVLDDGRLYLHRFWKYEQTLAKWIREKAERINSPGDAVAETIQKFISPGNSSSEVNWQHVALCLSFVKDLVVISGGPGTGKTFTVLNIIAAHAHHHKNEKFRVALAAPTGKAARRLSESIAAGKNQILNKIEPDIEIPDAALTVHKLLGSDFHGEHFKFNEKNKLPYDLVVIDEASMLDITMWVRLIRAIDDHTKLIVLGDKDQLASVEAGSILGDICGGENSFSGNVAEAVDELSGIKIPEKENLPAINDSVIFLTKSYRFDQKSGIRKLADAINQSDPETALNLLQDPEYPDLKLLEPSAENMKAMINEFATDHFMEYQKRAEADKLDASNQKKILCALRRGPYGVEQINANAEQQIKRAFSGVNAGEWYSGRIVMAKRNDSVLKIRNGEIGISTEADEELVHFEGEGSIPVSAGRLQEYEPAYAITIHKSQGSEFEDVAIVLPTAMNPVLSKEILYTSVTRARQSALVIGTKEIIQQTILNSVARNSGLGKRIWNS
ncbi:MAG: exodeoxyribonuclease V subunit alpha [Balneolaceae bacterium]